jgi:hypothetical protein
MLVLPVPRPMGTQCHLFDVPDQAEDPFLSAAARMYITALASLPLKWHSNFIVTTILST